MHPRCRYDSAASIVLLLILFLCNPFERRGVVDFFSEQPGKGVFIVALTSTLAFAYNIVSFYLIQYTSSVTSSVLGVLKTVVIIIVATVLLDKVASTLNWFGYAVFTGGLCAFSYLMYRRKQAKEADAPGVAASAKGAKAGAKESDGLLASSRERAAVA